MDSQVSSQVHASRKKNILRQTVLILLVNNRLIDVTQLALTLARWRNGFDLRANLIATKVSASHRKST